LLPIVPVPLNPGEAEATFDLKAILESAYDAGGFVHRAYRKSPVPRLPESEADWADSLIAKDTRPCS